MRVTDNHLQVEFNPTFMAFLNAPEYLSVKEGLKMFAAGIGAHAGWLYGSGMLPVSYSTGFEWEKVL